MAEVNEHKFLDKDIEKILATHEEGGADGTIEICFSESVNAVVFDVGDVVAMAKHFCILGR